MKQVYLRFIYHAYIYIYIDHRDRRIFLDVIQYMYCIFMHVFLHVLLFFQDQQQRGGISMAMRQTQTSGPFTSPEELPEIHRDTAAKMPEVQL